MTQQAQTHPVLCNVCGSNSSKPLWTAVDRLHGFAGQFQYVRCADCGLLYMNPQITPRCIPQFYPHDYAPHQAQDKQTSKPDLPKIILNSLTPDSRVLDVGCGNGGFLNQLRQFCHCRVNGLDVAENAVLCARKQYGIDVFQGEIFDAPFEDNTFDLITARSCIEHIHDPMQAVKKAFALCKPSGCFVVKTPNCDSLPAKFFKNKWYHLDCPRHLFIFSSQTIKMLLEKCGFEVVRICFEPSAKGWLGSLQYVFYGNNYRPETKNKLRRSSFARMLVSPVSHLSAWLKQADTMLVIARRKNL